MTRLQWSNEDPTYEIGVDHGVLYPNRNTKLAWDGLTSVKETSKIDGVKPVYFEGQKIIQKTDVGDFAGSITAFTYPEELDYLKDIYAITFRTLGENNKTRLHIIYNPVLVADPVDYQSFGSNIDPVKFSWSITNKPTYLNGYAPSGHFIIELYNVPDPFVNEIELMLYDTSGVFPTPQDLIVIFEKLAI